MKALKFILSGETAFFKVPMVNSVCYFTYGNIHKPALLGMFGAILGYKGYGYEITNFPEYYEKLKDVKISIVPNSENGYFNKKFQQFNNSVGYASQEQGGNLIVKEQWLEDPSWTIYIMLNNDESQKLADMIIHSQCVYIPYLGKNDHLATIEKAEYVEVKNVDAENLTIQSLSLSEALDFDQDEMDFKYEEYLPLTLNLETNHHELKKFILTNAPVEEAFTEIYEDGEKHITFY